MKHYRSRIFAVCFILICVGFVAAAALEAAERRSDPVITTMHRAFPGTAFSAAFNSPSELLGRKFCFEEGQNISCGTIEAVTVSKSGFVSIPVKTVRDQVVRLETQVPAERSVPATSPVWQAMGDDGAMGTGTLKVY